MRLIEAVKNKDRETVRALLKQKADVNTPGGDGATALHWAVRWDDVETTDLLLRAGADVDAANDYGVTPLWLACVNRSVPVVKKLLAAGADPNAATSMGETALMTCAHTGSADAVVALLEHGASNINAKEVSRGQTALMWAAQGHPEVVQVLLERGADVTARTETRRLLVSLGGRGPNGAGELELGGFTPLLFAARQGDVESARLLLDAGADVNETASEGASVLVVASFSGHGKLAAFLLDRGADPNAAGAGYAPLHTAVLRGDLELVKALLAHKADPNIRLTKGSRVPRSSNWWTLPGSLAGATPFLLAANYAEAGIMRVLAANGADPLLPLQDGTTPLMAAAGALWTQPGASPVDRHGRAVSVEVADALMADERPNWEAAQLALELGNNVNATNRTGNTALHAALYRAFSTVIELLVEHGGSLDLRNKDGKAPTDLACYDSTKPGDPRLRELLGDHGQGGKLVRCAG